MKKPTSIAQITKTLGISAYTSRKLVAAAKEAIALRDRVKNPDGKFDSQGRFYLAHKCRCCEEIRSPSRSYPFSEMVHGRTVKHVANAMGVGEHLATIKLIMKILDKRSAANAA